MGKIDYNQLFENNRKWIEEKNIEQADFFDQLSAGQNPKYLFVGCSDSRVPLDSLVKADPGEFFIHRNIANQVNLTDMNFLSVLEFSIEYLFVEYIIVAGHYSCGGVAAAIDGVDQGLIENWVSPIKDLYEMNKSELSQIDDKRKMADRLSEINVISQIEKILKTPSYQKAIERNQYPKVHGWIFNIYNGEIIELELPVEQWKDAGLLPSDYEV